MIRLKTDLKEKSSHYLTKQFVKKVHWKKNYFFSLLLRKIRKNMFKDNEVSVCLELKTTFYMILKFLQAKEFSLEIEGFLIQESSLLVSSVERKKNQCARTIYQKEQQFYKKVSLLLYLQFSFSNICGLQNFDSFWKYKNLRNKFLRPSKNSRTKTRLLNLFRSYKSRKIAKGSEFLTRIKTFKGREEQTFPSCLKRVRQLKRFKRIKIGPLLQPLIWNQKSQEVKKEKSRLLNKKLFHSRLSLFAHKTQKLKRYRFFSLFLRKKKSVFRALSFLYSKEYIKFLQKKERKRKVLKKRLWRRKSKKKWRWRRLGVFRLFRIRYRLRNKFSIPKHFEVNYKTGTFVYLGFLDFHSLNVRLPFRLNLRRLVTYLSS